MGQTEALRKDKGGSLTRFGLRLRLEHIVLMVTFIALAVTGIVQRYYTADLARWLILQMGGIETTRLIHRGFGLILTIGMLYHFGLLYYQVYIRHARLSMMPTLQDLRNIMITARSSNISD
jgi:cytochrome b subunit of formate dehydrogenase